MEGFQNLDGYAETVERVDLGQPETSGDAEEVGGGDQDTSEWMDVASSSPLRAYFSVFDGDPETVRARVNARLSMAMALEAAVRKGGHLIDYMSHPTVKHWLGAGLGLDDYDVRVCWDLARQRVSMQVHALVERWFRGGRLDMRALINSFQMAFPGLSLQVFGRVYEQARKEHGDVQSPIAVDVRNLAV